RALAAPRGCRGPRRESPRTLGGASDALVHQRRATSLRSALGFAPARPTRPAVRLSLSSCPVLPSAPRFIPERQTGCSHELPPLVWHIFSPVSRRTRLEDNVPPSNVAKLSKGLLERGYVRTRRRRKEPDLIHLRLLRLDEERGGEDAESESDREPGP